MANHKYDWREQTGTDVMPEYNLRYWIVEGLLTLQKIYSEILEPQNQDRRKKEFTRKVAEIQPFLKSYIKHEKKFTTEAKALKTAMEKIEEQNGNLKKETAKTMMENLNEYYYLKGFTALDAKAETDYGKSLL